MTNEELVLYTTASTRTYIDGSNIGLPVVYMSQEKDDRTEDRVTIQISHDLRRRGSANEDYALLLVTATVRTREVSTDVYYHARVCARVTDVLNKPFPCKRMGRKDLDRAVVGILRPVPAETITLGPAEPNASVIEAMFEYQPC